MAVEINSGEIFGLVGPNGAGKTTFVKLLCTLLLPSSGEAFVCGHDVVREAHRVKHLVGLVASEERSFFWRLTGRENLQFFGTLYNLSRRQTDERIDELFELLELTEVGNVRFNEYSTGMRQKLAIARGLLSQPKVLFMDEPTKGLDPLSAQALLAVIRRKLAAFSRSTIILTTHILRDVEQLCDRLAIMNRGRMIACGTVADLRAVSRQHQTYRLRVRGLADGNFRELTRIHGVVACTKLWQIDGTAEIKLDLQGDSPALSEALRQMLEGRGQIVSCTLEEERFDEVFGNIVQQGEGPTRYRGNTTTC
jgi:ABC-2 type transport system ATP-binding protein